MIHSILYYITYDQLRYSWGSPTLKEVT